MVFHVELGNRGRKDQQFPWEMCGGPSHGEERAGGPGKHIAAPQKLENSRSELWLEPKRIITSAEQGWDTCSSTQSCPEASGEASLAGLTQKTWDVSSDF